MSSCLLVKARTQDSQTDAGKLANDLADEIARLQAEIDRLRKALRAGRGGGR